VPQATAALVASLERKNSSLVLACLARWYVAPKSGDRIASSAVWLKTRPRAIAEGLTAGRSVCYYLGLVCLDREDGDENGGLVLESRNW
jgi:hypothetical protein